MTIENAVFRRTELLLGTDVVEHISKQRVIIFGVGGVGSWCAEGLVRSGIRYLTIVDSDRVCITNINRQLMATTETIGQVKVDALKKRLLTINPSAEINAMQKVFTEETAQDFHLEEYDYIIVTAPLYIPDKRADGQIGMVDYFDARSDEKELFSKIDYERYDVLAVETRPEDHPEISYYVFDNMVPAKLGHLMVYYRRWRDTKDQVITTYALRKHKDMEEVPYDVCRQTVLDDLKVMGNPASNVINEWSVYYFPHVFSEDYKNGWYEKVEAMQGKYRTFYAGEIMSFGDMDETAEYSRELVERFF